jgi:hypothetical protein
LLHGLNHSAKPTASKFWAGHQITIQQHFVELCTVAEVTRKANGLRHAFCTCQFAAHANENQTAQQAGNSCAMIHAHYKGLATKVDAKKWFNVLPREAAKNVIGLAAATRKRRRIELPASTDRETETFDCRTTVQACGHPSATS